MRDCPSDADALLHPAGEFFRITVHGIGETDDAEVVLAKLFPILLRRVRINAVDAQLHVLKGSHPRQQTRRLKDDGPIRPWPDDLATANNDAP